ncbi:MAG: MFS transporter, partial [Pseudomonadales bacterium]
MIAKPHRLTRWLIFLVLSADFFMVVGSTYGSLGVALPYMIEEMNWSWTSAGSGFTILALMSGLGSVLPAVIIRKIGIRANYLGGGLLMAGGFTMLALASDLPRYFLGTFMVGLGFPLLANVPGVQVITQWMPDRRSLAIGAFMTIGGLGGVFGPLLVTAIVEATGSWRLHWALMAAVILILGLLSTLIVRSAPELAHAGDDEASLPKHSARGKVFYTSQNWSGRDALKTPQFIFIALALTMSMFCVLTGNTWAVAHMDTLGVATVIAAGSLSVAAAVNASSRMLGGLVATRIDPKWLLASALVAEAAGMLALAVADNPLAIAIFAIG